MVIHPVAGTLPNLFPNTTTTPYTITPLYHARRCLEFLLWKQWPLPVELLHVENSTEASGVLCAAHGVATNAAFFPSTLLAKW